jgi:hypothetical protein
MVYTFIESRRRGVQSRADNLRRYEKYNSDDPEYTETTFSFTRIAPSQKPLQAIVPIVKAVKLISLEAVVY